MFVGQPPTASGVPSISEVHSHVHSASSPEALLVDGVLGCQGEGTEGDDDHDDRVEQLVGDDLVDGQPHPAQYSAACPANHSALKPSQSQCSAARPITRQPD